MGVTGVGATAQISKNKEEEGQRSSGSFKSLLSSGFEREGGGKR